MYYSRRGYGISITTQAHFSSNSKHSSKPSPIIVDPFIHLSRTGLYKSSKSILRPIIIDGLDKRSSTRQRKSQKSERRMSHVLVDGDIEASLEMRVGQDLGMEGGDWELGLYKRGSIYG